MKILLAVHRYAPHPGGSESVMHWLAQKMVNRGHQVEVVTDEDIMFRQHLDVPVQVLRELYE